MDLQTLVNSQRNQSQWITPTFSEKPKCDLCEGTGWITWKDHEGRLWAKRCQCQVPGQVKQKAEVSGLSDAMKRQTFDSFRVDTEFQKEMRDVSCAYFAALTDPENHPFRPWMFVGGSPGSGKTHICTAVCNELLKKNVGVKYMLWQDESRRLKSLVNAADYENEISPFLTVQVLYIDDMLKQKYSESPEFTEADIKIAFSILNSRYLSNKPTIISSEWELGQLLQADEGVFSRVYERCRGYIVHVPRDNGNNFRLGGDPGAV